MSYRKSDAAQSIVRNTKKKQLKTMNPIWRGFKATHPTIHRVRDAPRYIYMLECPIVLSVRCRLFGLFFFCYNLSLLGLNAGEQPVQALRCVSRGNESRKLIRITWMCEEGVMLASCFATHAPREAERNRKRTAESKLDRDYVFYIFYALVLISSVCTRIAWQL